MRMIQIHQSLTNNNKTRQLPDISMRQDPCGMESEYVGERYTSALMSIVKKDEVLNGTGMENAMHNDY